MTGSPETTPSTPAAAAAATTVTATPSSSSPSATAATAPASSSDITASFLSSITHQEVNVALYNDFVYTGVLASIDGYMNVVLQNASEIVNGKTMKTYEEVFLRGNNVIYISKA